MMHILNKIIRLWSVTGDEWSEQTLKELSILLRREIHRFPEPGWLTFRTTALAAELLEQLGFSVQAGEEIVARAQVIDAPVDGQIRKQRELWEEAASKNRGTEYAWYQRWRERMGDLGGVVAVYDSRIPGKTIAYRFDMDSLELAESTSCNHVPQKEGFGSVCEGRFHACGHDGHVAMGLCLAKMLMEQRESIKGKLMFIFQPAEEGVRGAKSYCDHWKYGNIDQLFCCHIGFAPEGTLVAGANGFLATTKLDVEFTGKSAHAGLCPERGRNALLAAADAMVQMQDVKSVIQEKQDCIVQGMAKNSRERSIKDAGLNEGVHQLSKEVVRLNVGSLRGGEARNTIPAHAVMKLETRGSNTVLNQSVRTYAEKIIKQCADKYEVDYKISKKGESDSADSSEELSRAILQAAEESKEFECCALHQDFGASDDGAVFMNMVQSAGGQAAYLLFGTALAGKHHETDFDFDEDIMRKGCKVLYQCFWRRS